MAQARVAMFTPFQKLLISIALLLVFAGLLWLFHGLLKAILLSMMLAMMFSPVVDQVERFKVSRGTAVALSFGLMGVLLGLALAGIIPLIYEQTLNLIADWPVYLAELKSSALDIQAHIALYAPSVQKFDLVSEATHAFSLVSSHVIKDMSGVLSNLLGVAELLILVPFTTFFLLKDGSTIRRGFLSAVPNRYFELILNLVCRIEAQTSSYIRGVLLESCLVASLSIVGLLILGVKYAFVIGIVAGVANIIPYLGPVCGTIPALMVTFMNPTPGVPWWAVLVLFWIIQMVDNHVFQPVIFARSINVHPVLILFSLILGGSWYGLWGMLFAVPILGVVNVVVQEVYKELTFRLN